MGPARGGRLADGATPARGMSSCVVPAPAGVLRDTAMMNRRAALAKIRGRGAIVFASDRAERKPLGMPLKRDVPDAEYWLSAPVRSRAARADPLADRHLPSLVPGSIGLLVHDYDGVTLERGNGEKYKHSTAERSAEVRAVVVETFGAPLFSVPSASNPYLWHAYYWIPEAESAGRFGNLEWRVGDDRGDVRCGRGFIFLHDPDALVRIAALFGPDGARLYPDRTVTIDAVTAFCAKPKATASRRTAVPVDGERHNAIRGRMYKAAGDADPAPGIARAWEAARACGLPDGETAELESSARAKRRPGDNGAAPALPDDDDEDGDADGWIEPERHPEPHTPVHLAGRFLLSDEGRRYRYVPEEGRRGWYRFDAHNVLCGDAEKRLRARLVKVGARCWHVERRARGGERYLAPSAAEGGKVAVKAGTLDILPGFRGVTVSVRALDHNPDLLAFPDGQALELDTGRMRAITRADLVTRHCPVVPAEWRGTAVESMLAGFGLDAETRAWMDRFHGAILGALSRAKALFILTGVTDAGKSAYLSALAAALGTYYGAQSAAD